MSVYDVTHLRSELPILREWTYLNTGTVGIMPDPVFDELMQIMRHYEQGGHTAQADVVAGAERAKRALAELLGAEAHNLALNRNATDGINLVASTFQLSPGDEVITSTQEHPAMVLPLLHACEHAGAKLRFVPFVSDPDELVGHLGDLVSEQTKLVAISHVSCETGARLPVEVVRDVVGPDVAILIDASQSVGQFEVSIQDMRADFVIGNGHKWLAGPKGSGFAWVSPDSEHLIAPAYVASDSFDPHWSRDYYQKDPAPALKYASGAAKYEFGTRSWHLHAGLAAAIDYQTALGIENIAQHLSTMSTAVKEDLARIPGVTVHSPLSWKQSSGLVTFSVDGQSRVDVSRQLWDDYRIAQRRVEEPSAVRISCAYFTDDEDLAKIVGAVQNIVGS
ncbi:MAG: aminotransferase class V-fold PLP-dependent enzyme [Thermomicrobiales bacterium]